MKREIKPRHALRHRQEADAEEDHNETTCMICYMEYYGRMPIDLEGFKYGKGTLK